MGLKCPAQVVPHWPSVAGNTAGDPDWSLTRSQLLATVLAYAVAVLAAQVWLAADRLAGLREHVTVAARILG
jgi:hypothetical protein